MMTVKQDKTTCSYRFFPQVCAARWLHGQRSTELPFSLDGKKKHGLIIQKTSDPTRKAAFFMTFGFNDDAGFDPGWPAHDPPSDRVANEPCPVRLIRIRLTWAPWFDSLPIHSSPSWTDPVPPPPPALTATCQQVTERNQTPLSLFIL